MPVQEETVHYDPLDVLALRSVLFFYALEMSLPLLIDRVVYWYILLFVQVVVRDVLRGYDSCTFDLHGPEYMDSMPAFEPTHLV